MIVQCENCETRFHVADARIPEKGARVRCSRCHHRFHITPSSGTSAGPSPADDVSASGEVSGPTPEPAPPAKAAPVEKPEKAERPEKPEKRGPRDDDELDNPEFLFEDGATPSRPTPRAPAPPPAAASEPEPEIERNGATHSPDLEPPKEPAKPLEERVVGTGGKTAQEMLDLGAPKLGGAKVEFGTVQKDGPPEDFFGADEREPVSEPPPKPPAVKLVPVVRPPVKPPAPPPPAAASELDAGFGGPLGDEDEGDPGWDSLTKSEESRPTSVFDAAASFGLAKSPAAPPVTTTGSAPLFAEGDAPADTKKRHAPAVSTFDPEAKSPVARIVNVAAFFVGVALLAGMLRGLELQRASSESAPSAEQSAGWIAADVETFVARDSSGERVLIVRGNLFPDGAAPPPEVEVSLLETSGARVGEPRRAWLERLDDAEIAPEELSVKLASNAGELSGVGPKVTGFTALLADPPARARRVQVTLAPGHLPMRGTATAVAPTPSPAPAGGNPAAGNTQLAAPQAPAPAPAPAGDGAVVPAAPAPE